LAGYQVAQWLSLIDTSSGRREEIRVLLDKVKSR
jgi:hypothetical protein